MRPRLVIDQLSKLQPYITRRLVVAFALFALCAVIFLNIAEEVVEQETLQLDSAILLWINSWATSWLDLTAIVLTQFGGSVAVAVVTIGLSLLFLIRRQRSRAFIMLSGAIGAGLINVLFKSFFARERPELWERLVYEHSFSFPSGHAMASAALGASLVAALWYSRWRLPAVIGATLYVIIIGFTRLYLGVHYPTDIVAGWTVSIAWVVIVFVIFTRPENRSAA